ncbi:hypothetical protein FGLOB1_8539 [Fusarium globosum]|uniref:Uncharacterized protein n=1 Tax=Fusarium globosum TaxID=78864 RepID=A0A8H5Y3B3_9HYPO|nr:hypothetical protein FGLOB1_8539 [Fusarium globosum]
MDHHVFDTETGLGLEDGTLMPENTASSFFVLEMIAARELVMTTAEMVYYEPQRMTISMASKVRRPGADLAKCPSNHRPEICMCF